MEMALRTHIVRKMIDGRIGFNPEFKEMLPGGADSLSFLEVWGMPEGTIFNIYSEFLKMTEQGIQESEIVDKLELADNQLAIASVTSGQPISIEEYIKLRVKRDHGECTFDYEFINAFISFIPLWLEEVRHQIERIQPKINIIKKLISKDFLYSYDQLSDIEYSIQECKPPIGFIKTTLGNTHDVYLSLSNEIVSHFQSKTIAHVNLKLKEQSRKRPQSMVESVSDSFMFGNNIIAKALDVMYWLNGFYMEAPLKIQFEKHFEDLKLLAKNNGLVTLYKDPKSKFEECVHHCEDKLNLIRGTTYYEIEIKNETQILNNLRRWHLFRNKISKEKQIHEQTEKLNIMIAKSEAEKRSKISEEQELINIFKENIRIFEI